MRIDKLLVVESAEAEKSVDRIVRLDIEEVLDGASLEILIAVGYLIALKPVAASLACEEQHGLVHCGRIDKLGEVLLACACSL